MYEKSRVMKSVGATLLVAIVFFLVVLIAGPDGNVSPYAVAASTTGVASSGTLQAQIANNNQQVAALNEQIAGYKAQLKQVGADKKTLQTAITALELRRKSVQAQTAITQTQIGTTKLQIEQLGGKIADTEQSIKASQASLGAYLRELQQDGDRPLLLQMLQVKTLSQIWDNMTAIVQVQAAVQKNTQALQAQKDNLADSRAASQEKQTALVTQKQQLAAEQQSLAATVQSKNQLLADTKAKESNYQKLLAAAETELQSFATFTQNAGGSKLLANQTRCDDWGCYYNQRDAAWGADSLDGTKYTLANAGCLVASVAMVLTHYGYKDVTPVTINANTDNFAPYAQDLLLKTITVDGKTVARQKGSLDAILATGHPAIVGMKVYGGTHFVVFVSGSKGKYIMNDPYVKNGKDVNFTDYYSLKDIFSVEKVAISTG